MKKLFTAIERALSAAAMLIWCMIVVFCMGIVFIGTTVVVVVNICTLKTPFLDAFQETELEQRINKKTDTRFSIAFGRSCKKFLLLPFVYSVKVGKFIWNIGIYEGK